MVDLVFFKCKVLLIHGIFTGLNTFYTELDKSESCHIAWTGSGQGKWSERHGKYSRHYPKRNDKGVESLLQTLSSKTLDREPVSTPREISKLQGFI